MRARRLPAAMATVTILVALAMVPLAAQWPRHEDTRIPRKADGTPNLEAPAPRTADGKPDLTGVWLNEWFYDGQVRPAVKAGPGEPPSSTFSDVGANFPNGLPLQPWAARLKAERREHNAKDNPDAFCLPMGIMQFHEHPQPRKMIQTPDVLVILYEGNAGVRQIFTDGRPSPPTILSRGGTATPPGAGRATRSWSGRRICATAAGSTSTGRRSPKRPPSPSGSVAPTTAR